MQNRMQRCCRHCQCEFKSDPRNRHHQQYCSKPECRQASKKASQQQWTSKDENRDYFRGHEHVLRVQEWRTRNPGYWRHPKQESEHPPDSCQVGSFSTQIIAPLESFSTPVPATSPLLDHAQAHPQTIDEPNSSVTRDLTDQLADGLMPHR